MRIQTNLDQIKSNLVQSCQIESNSIKPKSKSKSKSRSSLVKSSQIRSNPNPNPVRPSQTQIQIHSNPVKPKSTQIESNPNPNPVKSSQIQIQIWSNPVKPKSKSSQTQIQIQSNPNPNPVKPSQIQDLDLTRFGFGASLPTTAEWLRCLTRIHKILYCIITHGMTLDKLLTANLSQMTHSCRANTLSVSTLAGGGADTAVRKKKRTVETGCTWILIITAAAATGDMPVGDYYYNHNCEKHKVIHSERFSGRKILSYQ